MEFNIISDEEAMSKIQKPTSSIFHTMSQQYLNVRGLHPI